MSAPDTNVKKQTARHRPSLLGIAAAVAIAAIALMALVFWPKPLATDDAASAPVTEESR